MRVGLEHYSLHPFPWMTGLRVLDLVSDLGLGGIQFVGLRDISPRLDAGELREVEESARSRGWYLEVGISSINARHLNTELKADGDGDVVVGLRRTLERIKNVEVGSNAVRCVIGGPGDRALPAWRDELAETVELISAIAPILRDLELTLSIENHADLSIDELIEIIDEVGADVASICLDTANAFNVLEDPLQAARRAAPYTTAMHLKDGILTFADEGLIVDTRPVGQGMLSVAEILHAVWEHNPGLNVSIENYGMPLLIPIFEPAFTDSFSSVRLPELAELVRLARQGTDAVAAGATSSIAAAQFRPWSARALTDLSESARFVNGVVAQLGMAS